MNISKRLSYCFYSSLSYLLALSLVASSAPYAAFGAASTASASASRPDADRILKARALAHDGKTDEASKILSAAIADEKDRERRALERMALAVILYQSSTSQSANSDAASDEQFAKAIEDGSRISDYAYYYRGLLQKKSDHRKEARADFERVIEARTTPKPTEYDARYQLAQILLADKLWKPATVQLEVLRKGLKSDERYPEVLYHLVQTEMKSGRKANACKWARELYSKYPTSPLILNDVPASGTSVAMQAWGPHLEKNTVEGEKLGCTANSKDLKTRVRRLWLSGEDERAAKELKDLKDENDDDGYSLVDTLMISNLIGDGKVVEALKLLLKRYQGEHGRPGYLLLLGKAASAAGEYQMAVAAYQRAYDISPHGKNGAHALFQAAFTSYQMQDYDGASRRFEQLLKQRSTLARDAQWHLAWIRYLRGDYQGAYDSFAILSKQKVSKRVVRRRKGRKATVLVSSDNVAQDRIGYWSAMSLLKMNRGQEAAPHFMALAKDPSIGYYALLSYYRLLAIPGVKIPQEVEARWGLKRGDAATPSEDELKAAALSSAESAQADYEEEVTKADGEEETTDADAESEAEVPTETKTVTATVPVDEKAANFKDAGLAQKFERARDLVLVGLEDAARRELREIEKRARSSADRKLLMVEYANVKNYERSSFIAETGFGAERLRTGLKGESRPFWEHAYPRAWEQAVVQSSRSTSVPEELIWGIMRAESHFRFDAQSPVGALGLMQLMPFTGRKVADLLNIKAFETRSLLNPDTNIRLGSRYLQRLVEKFSGKVPLVAASYNAGPHRVYAWVRNFGSLDMDEFIEHIPYIETRNYVKRVVRNFQIYSLLYHKSADGMRWLIQPVGVQLGDQQAPREIW